VSSGAGAKIRKCVAFTGKGSGIRDSGMGLTSEGKKKKAPSVTDVVILLQCMHVLHVLRPACLEEFFFDTCVAVW
jgi:hypothetical protein